MPIGEIVGETLGGIARVVGEIVVQVVLEVVIKGVGYALIRLVRPRSEPSDGACGVVGLVFWIAVAAGGYGLYRLGAGA